VYFEPVTDEVPVAFKLRQNYPNPFNPMTTIEFEVEKLTPVRLSVYDALGKTVAILADQSYASGRYTLTFSATNLPSGVYFYRLDTDEVSETKTMVLLK
jgi:hypothetical protein